MRTKAPELALLNKNTTFFVDQISDEVHGFDSSVQVIYGDCMFFIYYLFLNEL